jgi:hypothetical protein
MQDYAKLSLRLLPAAAARKLQIDFLQLRPQERKITVVVLSNDRLL